MKNIFILLFVFLLIASGSYAAKAEVNGNDVLSDSKSRQNDEWTTAKTPKKEVWSSRKSIISVNVSDLIFSAVSLRYEISLGDLLGLGFEANYGKPLTYWDFLYGARLDLNFYFQNHAPNAFFLGPFIGFQTFTYKHAYDPDSSWLPPNDGTMRYGLTSYGIQSGYRWILVNGFSVDLKGYGEYTSFDAGLNYKFSYLSFWGGIYAGYAF